MCPGCPKNQDGAGTEPEPETDLRIFWGYFFVEIASRGKEDPLKKH